MPLLLRKLFRRRIVLGAAVALAIVVFIALFAGWLTGFDPNETAVRERLSQPSAAHLFGTDELGRDLFARIAFGGRYSAPRCSAPCSACSPASSRASTPPSCVSWTR